MRKNSQFSTADQVADAIVYLDAGSFEAFQFVGAFPLLLELGARAICSLENVSSLDAVVNWKSNFEDPAKKIVVITSRLLSDAHRYILRCLSMHSTVHHCMIFTSISEIAHSAYIDTPLGPDAFREYESLLLQDYEEFMCKHKLVKPDEAEETKPHEEVLLEDEGWQQLDSNEELTSSPGSGSTERLLGQSNASKGSSKLTVSVTHFPMILCPLSPGVFVLPSEGAVAEACLSIDHDDSVSPGLPAISNGAASDGEDIPPGATLTAHFLYHLAEKMDLKMEVFSLGDLSRNIGKILMDMSSLYDVGGRGKRSAGLLLVDRTLDLLSPCLHGDSLVDRMFASLPRRERMAFAPHTKDSNPQNKAVSCGLQRAPLDVRIPLESILSENGSPKNGFPFSKSMQSFVSGWSSNDKGSSVTSLNDQSGKVTNAIHVGCSETGFLSGSLVSTENHLGVRYLEALLDRKTKDGALLIKKWLQDALCREKLHLSLNIRPSPANVSELHSMIKLLASTQASLIRNKGIIQLAMAALVALSEPRSSRWKAFTNAEKILNFSATDTSQSLCGQICDLINKSSLVGSFENDKSKKSQQSLLSFQDAIVLAITGYILAGQNFATSGSGGPFSWEKEHSLKEAFADAILECSQELNFGFLRGLEDDLEAHRKKLASEKMEGTSLEQPTIDFEDQWGSWDEEDTEHNSEHIYGDMQLRLEIRDRVDHLFKVFHKLSGLNRNSISRGSLSIDDYSSDDTLGNRGLLYKLLRLTLEKDDIPGLHYHSSAVGRFFKSGFGRFGLGQAKPKFGDQSVLFVFIVGGINTVEIREAREVVVETGGPVVDLLLGGTTLLTANDMFDLLLGSSSYI
ncbi:hypothetical protein AMTR_s00045p00170740 [Amborella trichopoda]|uniref:Sec1 family domain-containing protein MIP3 n=1 Tax=Amborella trichopoda TaxID=13333 RepID=W1P3A4_AMBTC|nr:hypothetical protein AMTR_s00045p00170740 [Amborella trichopoda]